VFIMWLIGEMLVFSSFKPYSYSIRISAFIVLSIPIVSITAPQISCKTRSCHAFTLMHSFIEIPHLHKNTVCTTQQPSQVKVITLLTTKLFTLPYEYVLLPTFYQIMLFCTTKSSHINLSVIFIHMRYHTESSEGKNNNQNMFIIQLLINLCHRQSNHRVRIRLHASSHLHTFSKITDHPPAYRILYNNHLIMSSTEQRDNSKFSRPELQFLLDARAPNDIGGRYYGWPDVAQLFYEEFGTFESTEYDTEVLEKIFNKHENEMVKEFGVGKPLRFASYLAESGANVWVARNMRRCSRKDIDISMQTVSIIL
jgi:hypothetical protein